MSISMRAAWRGEKPLAATFWGYFLLGQVGLHGVFAGAGAGVVYGMYSGADAFSSFKGMLILFAVCGTYVLALLGYSVFSVVAVWRSARGYTGPWVLGMLSQGVVLAAFVAILCSLVLGFPAAP